MTEDTAATNVPKPPFHIESLNIESLNAHDFDEAIAFHNEVHGGDPICEELLRDHPDWSEPAVHRGIRLDGRLVSLTSLATTEQRFGSGTLKVGEIGLVGTLPPYRKRGLSRALMESWIETMQAEGHALAYLFGIGNFYEQWDFHYAAPDYVFPYLTASAKVLAPFKPPSTHRLRPLDPRRDLDQVMSLYAAASERSPCSPLRPSALWRYFFNLADRHGRDWIVVETAGGDRLTGYARFKRPDSNARGAQPPGAMTEVAAADEPTCVALAAELRRRLKETDEPEASLVVAPHQRFARWLYAHGARRASDTTMYPGSWAAMYHVNNLAAALEPWLEEWHARLARAASFPALALTVRAGRDPGAVATIEAGPGHVRVHPGLGGTAVDVPPSVIIPWLTGWRSFAESATTPSLAALSADERRFLDLIFPSRHPWIGDTYQG